MRSIRHGALCASCVYIFSKPLGAAMQDVTGWSVAQACCPIVFLGKCAWNSDANFIRRSRFVQDSENLRYCEMDIKDAPGLKDVRCGVASEECLRGALAGRTSSATLARTNSLATIGNKSGRQGCISGRRWQDLSPAAKDLLMGMMAYNTKHRLTAQQVRRGLKSCEPTTWIMILSCQGPVYGVSSHNPEHCVMDRHLRLKRAPAASFTPLLPFGYLLPAVCRGVSWPGPFKYCCLQPRQALASAPLSGRTTCFPSRQCGLRL